MKIVLDIQACQSQSRFRGIGRYSFSLAAAMIRNSGKHDIEVVLNTAMYQAIPWLRNELESVLPAGNIKVFKVPDNTAARRNENSWRASVAEKIREDFIAGLNPDIVHISSLFEGYEEDIVSSVPGPDSGILSAVTLYDLIPLVYPVQYLPNNELKQFYFKKLAELKKSDILLSISEYTKAEAIKLLDLSPDGIWNISAATDSSFKPMSFAPARAAEIKAQYKIKGKFILCAPGGFDERKNITGLIQAFKNVPVNIREDYQLVIASKIPDISLIMNMLKKGGYLAGTTEDVVFTGYLPDADLIALYNLCELSIFPSWHEGFGLPVLEAMACGAATLGANASSIPEVIGRSDAMFDPHDNSSISAKIVEVITNDNFRISLKEHAPRQAAKFSWDSSAKAAIQAFESVYDKKASIKPSSVVQDKMHTLAYFIESKELSTTRNDNFEIVIKELSRSFNLEIVTDVPDIQIERTIPQHPIRSVDFLAKNLGRYYAIVYHVSKMPVQDELFNYIRSFPGIVLLWDKGIDEFSGEFPQYFFKALGDATDYKDKMTIPCLLTQDIVSKYSLSTSFLKYASAYICFSENSQDLFMRIRGLESIPGHVLPMPHTWENKSGGSDPGLILNKVIDDLIKGSHAFLQYNLLKSISNIRASESALQDDLIRIAECIDYNSTKESPAQLFVDVSNLCFYDHRTGIQRVVRSILRELLLNPPAGYRVEPVYSTADQPYFYAREFSCRFLGISQWELKNEPIEYGAGDIFLGLDFSMDVVLGHVESLMSMKNKGVFISFVIYDLLPLTLPAYFERHITTVYDAWLKVILQFDSLMCISKAVADSLETWVSENRLDYNKRLKLDWFHLGADIASSSPSRGLPEDYMQTVNAIAARPAFLIVSTIEPRKGHVQTLEAFELLWEQGYEINLVFVGRTGWMMEQFSDILRGHTQWNHKLFWLEGVSDEYLDIIYRSSKCLLVPSVGEGFGLPLIEAARHRIPIIARNLDVFREVAGEHAFYFEGSEPGLLAREVVAWLSLQNSGKVPDSGQIGFKTWAESANQLFERIKAGTELNQNK